MTKQILRAYKVFFCGLLILSAVLSAASSGPGEQPLAGESDRIELKEVICYAKVDGQELLLDFYRPADAHEPLPLVIWIHGGGWRGGDKKNCPAKVLTQYGFAVASINYRLIDRATFPAQIRDCKGAIRFLRSRASEFGIDPDAFGVWGGSAGGSLAALVGTSGGVKELEGDVGGNLEYSSAVQAACDWFGRKQFIGYADPNSPESKRVPRLTALFSGTIDQRKQIAKAVSPVTHIDKTDPPFLIMHGSQDATVPVEESILFAEARKGSRRHYGTYYSGGNRAWL